MKKYLIKILSALIVGVGINTKFVFADSISSNNGLKNSHMNNQNGSVNEDAVIDAWHSSGGYWNMGYSDYSVVNGRSYFHVYDANVSTYFSGTSKRFEKTIKLRYELPQKVKDFINIYGASELGIKVNVGKTGSIFGDTVNYTIDNNYIYLEFFAVLKYDRYNMWEYYNPSVFNAMIPKVQTPEVTSGYGENYVSVRQGLVGMLLTPNIMRSAYKASDGTLKFSSSDTTTLGDGSTVIAKNEYALNNFFSGGSNGVYFRYPINIEFYDLNVNTNNPVISDYEYKDGNVYWVKDNDSFKIYYSGYASAYDDNVKVNGNYLQLKVNGNVGYINNNLDKNSNEGQGVLVTQLADVNLVNSSTTRNNETLNSSSTLTLNGDKDVEISTFSRLVDFPSTGGERIYKESTHSQAISVKSDGSAPVVSNYPNSDWSKNDVNINLQINDDRSGVQSSILYENGNEVARGTNSINYTETKEGIHTYKIVASDNVGNVFEKEFTVKIDKSAPTVKNYPSNDWSKNDVPINLDIEDSLSGVQSSILYENGNEVARGTNSINYTETKEGIHTYKIVASDNAGNVFEKEFTVKIDKTAPTGDVQYDYNEDTTDINIKVDNIIETGSGVDKIWAEISDKKDPNNKIEIEIPNVNGKFETTVNIYDKFDGKVDEVDIVIKAQDKVSNEGVLSQHEVDIFKITATIERVLAPHDPIFKGGEKGVIKIKMYGGVDKLKITFPTELTDLDSSLNAEINITPEKKSEHDYEFFVPLDALENGYNVQVKGFRNTREKEVYPRFSVRGSILNDIRTRVRI